ncbi:MAG: O-antigen ligase family protein [Promethearchaeota archaeon]
MKQPMHLDFNKKLLPLVGALFLFAGCDQWGVDPEVRFGLIILFAIISFIAVFTKPIFGIYAVSVISVIFSPPIRIGFTNLYFHQWVILIALLASLSSGLILGNLHTKMRSGINMPMTIFIGSLFLAMAHAPNTVIGIKSVLYIGVLIASYYLVLLCINTEREIKVFFILLVMATTVVCILSLMFHSSGRLGSLVLRNPNGFGNFLALVIPFLVTFTFYGRLRGGQRLILVLCLILMFVSLTLTFSRSAWVGVISSIILLSVLKPKTNLFFLLCGIIAATLLFSPIEKRIFKDIHDPGAQYRVIKARIAYEKFKENPILGNGLGSFHYAAQFSDVWAYYAHSTLENNYLLMLVEGGLVEFVAFLCLIIIFGKRALILLRKIKGPFLYPVLLGCITSIISTLVAGMFEDTLFFPKNNWLIGMFMGIVIVVGRIYEESTKEDNSTEVGIEEKTTASLS